MSSKNQKEKVNIKHNKESNDDNNYHQMRSERIQKRKKSMKSHKSIKSKNKENRENREMNDDKSELSSSESLIEEVISSESSQSDNNSLIYSKDTTKETKDEIDDKKTRFSIKKLLGEGSFSKLYLAYDSLLDKDVALKVEKIDKQKKILLYEYEVLKSLQKLNFIPRIYDFIYGKSLNFIVMELLGMNINNFKKAFNPNELICLELLMKMIDCIEEIHENGYIHRDIKPSNFVLSVNCSDEFSIINTLKESGALNSSKNHCNSCDNIANIIHNHTSNNENDSKGKVENNIGNNHSFHYNNPTNNENETNIFSNTNTNIHNKYQNYNDQITENIISSNSFIKHLKVFLIDFGLSKHHLDRNGNVFPAKRNNDFRGTLVYASLNAHFRKELSRRDDLWSFYFVILEFLNIELPWREKSKKMNKEEVGKTKELCVNNPEAFIFNDKIKWRNELKSILDHLKSLNYEDKPNYSFIKSKLEEMKFKIIFELKNDFCFIKKNEGSIGNGSINTNNTISNINSSAYKRERRNSLLNNNNKEKLSYANNANNKTDKEKDKLEINFNNEENISLEKRRDSIVSLTLSNNNSVSFSNKNRTLEDSNSENYNKEIIVKRGGLSINLSQNEVEVVNKLCNNYYKPKNINNSILLGKKRDYTELNNDILKENEDSEYDEYKDCMRFSSTPKNQKELNNLNENSNVNSHSHSKINYSNYNTIKDQTDKADKTFCSKFSITNKSIYNNANTNSNGVPEIIVAKNNDYLNYINTNICLNLNLNESISMKYNNYNTMNTNHFDIIDLYNSVKNPSLFNENLTKSMLFEFFKEESSENASNYKGKKSLNAENSIIVNNNGIINLKHYLTTIQPSLFNSFKQAYIKNQNKLLSQILTQKININNYKSSSTNSKDIPVLNTLEDLFNEKAKASFDIKNNYFTLLPNKTKLSKNCKSDKKENFFLKKFKKLASLINYSNDTIFKFSNTLYSCYDNINKEKNLIEKKDIISNYNNANNVNATNKAIKISKNDVETYKNDIKVNEYINEYLHCLYLNDYNIENDTNNKENANGNINNNTKNNTYRQQHLKLKKRRSSSASKNEEAKFNGNKSTADKKPESDCEDQYTNKNIFVLKRKIN